MDEAPVEESRLARPRVGLLPWLFWMVAGGLLLMWLSGDLFPVPPNREVGLIMCRGAFFLSAIAVTLVLSARGGGSPFALFGPAPTGQHLLLATAMALAFVPFKIGTFSLLWTPLSYWSPALASSVLDGGGSALGALESPWTWGAIFYLVVAEALAEELLFRRVALDAWAPRQGVVRAAFRSSILFACLHPDWLGSLCFGIASAMLLLRTGSLWPSIAFHAVTSALMVGLARFGRTTPLHLARSIDELREHLARDLSLLVIGVGALVLLWRFFEPARPWTLPLSSREENDRNPAEVGPVVPPATR